MNIPNDSPILLRAAVEKAFTETGKNTGDLDEAFGLHTVAKGGFTFEFLQADASWPGEA